MSQFKRFNTSENDNYNSSDAYPEGTLTWDPSNGLRLHDGSTGGGNTVGGSGTAFTRFINSGIGNYDANNNTSYNMTISPNWDGEFTGNAYINLPSNENFGSPLQIVQNSTGGVQIITQNDAAWSFGADGNLTLPVNGDIKDRDGNSVLGGGGTTLPADASGYLHNDGAGALSWTQNTAGTGSNSFSDVWVTSTRSGAFWTDYTLTGDMIILFNYGGSSSSNITLTNQAVSGKQFSVGQKVLIVNDAASLNSHDYGIVVEFPSSPSIGDTFSAPVLSPLGETTLGVSQMASGGSYTIASVGTTTNWGAIGIFSPTVGQQFTYNYGPGYLSGDGTVTGQGAVGPTKLIFKPASGQRALSFNQGQSGALTEFGQGASAAFSYLDLSSGMGQQPVTWVYGGVVDSIPTWYQVWG